MTIETVINSVDEIYPNAISTAEKARLCYELSCQIRAEVKRLFAEYEFECEKDLTYLLPDEILFEDIDCIFENGVRIEKTDARAARTPGGGCAYRAKDGGRIRVVYLTRPEPYVDKLLCDYTIDGRVIHPVGVSLKSGDKLVFTEGENAGRSAVVLVAQDGGYLVSEELSPGEFSGGGQVHRTYATEVGAPHDSMYVDYLLGKIMFYQQDFEAASQYLAQFNAKWDTFVGVYKRTEPQVKRTYIRNLW